MSKTNIWKGCAAGMAGGLAATLVMTGFQSAWTAAMPKNSGKNGDGSQSSAKSESEDLQNEGKSQSENVGPTSKVANKIVGITGRELSPEGKKTGGAVVHYAFGTLMGAVYGTTLEFAPRRYRRNALGSGLIMGSALFAAADEVALPALRLTPNPVETPGSMHLYGFVSHLIYGVTAGLITRTLRKAM